MKTTIPIGILILILTLSLSKTCLAQDWAKSIESSTAPTDYQAILDQNLAMYRDSNHGVVNPTVSAYEHRLSQNISNMRAAAALSMPNAPSIDPATAAPIVISSKPENAPQNMGKSPNVGFSTVVPAAFNARPLNSK